MVAHIAYWIVIFFCINSLNWSPSLHLKVSEHGKLSAATIYRGKKSAEALIQWNTNTHAGGGKKTPHTVRQERCSGTVDKNHQRTHRGFIDEGTTEEGGTTRGGVTHKWIGDVVCESVCDTDNKVFKMTPLVFLFALTLGHVTAGVVELSCSDNATCIESMLKETARSLRQQKTVRLFDALTIEPLNTRQARANDAPLTRFTKNHAFSFDWNDYTFRVTRPKNNDDVMDLEIYESRSAKGKSTKKILWAALRKLVFRTDDVGG